MIYLDEKYEVSYVKQDTVYYRSVINEIKGVYDGGSSHEAILKLLIDYVLQEGETLQGVYIVTTSQAEGMFEKVKRFIEKFLTTREYEIQFKIEKIVLEKKKSIDEICKEYNLNEAGRQYFIDHSGIRKPYAYLQLLSTLEDNHMIRMKCSSGIDEYGEILEQSQVQYREPQLSALDQYFYESIIHLYGIVEHEEHKEELIQLCKDAILEIQYSSSKEQVTKVMKFLITDDSLFEVAQAVKIYNEAIIEQRFSVSLLEYYVAQGLHVEAITYYNEKIDSFLIKEVFKKEEQVGKAKEQVETYLYQNYEPRIFKQFLLSFGSFIDVSSSESIDVKYMTSKFIEYLGKEGNTSEKAASSIRKFSIFRAAMLGREISSERSGTVETLLKEVEELAKSKNIPFQWKEVYRMLILDESYVVLSMILEVDMKSNRALQIFSSWEEVIEKVNEKKSKEIRQLLIDRYLMERSNQVEKIEYPLFYLSQIGYPVDELDQKDVFYTYLLPHIYEYLAIEKEKEQVQEVIVEPIKKKEHKGVRLWRR